MTRRNMNINFSIRLTTFANVINNVNITKIFYN